MRTLFQHGLVLAALGAAVACGRPQPQSPSPIGGEPKPQQAITEPKPGQSQNPIESGPQQSTLSSGPAQDSTMSAGQPQQPITETTPQKPFGGEPPQNTQAKQEKPLTDGEILAVVEDANTGEIDMATLAKKNASATEVKNYAAMMLMQHGDAQTKARNLQSKAKIKADENDVSAHVKSEASTAISNLRDKSGAEFDRLYIDTQVRAHKDVLDTIDTKLLPQANNGQLKSYLQDVRKHVAMHLDEAEKIQKKIDPTSAAAHAQGMSVEDQSKAKTQTPAKSDTEKKKKSDEKKGAGDKGAPGNRY